MKKRTQRGKADADALWHHSPEEEILVRKQRYHMLKGGRRTNPRQSAARNSLQGWKIYLTAVHTSQPHSTFQSMELHQAYALRMGQG